MNIKTRFAPSPTGSLHLGSIRTALYSWLFAKHYNGKFVLRIEDTDLQRSQKHSVDNILHELRWLGLNWDEGPYFQTKRLDRYKDVINRMLKQGSAYKCFCSSQKLELDRIKQIKNGVKPRYSRYCRDLNINKIYNKEYVIRFKNPISGKVTFNDAIRGNITFENSELDDLIIQRSNGMPTYNFCVVIDDLDMKITHVIRGEDHINNTPRQINILQSLGSKIPVYAHLSMILDEQGNKISKRNTNENIMDFDEKGFLPEALLNYVVKLGWSHRNQEIFNISEMIKLFSLKFITKSPSIINMKKLFWINKHYINNLPLENISNLLKVKMHQKKINLKNGPCLEKMIHLLRHRFNTINEMANSFRMFYEEFDIVENAATKKYLILNNVSVLEESYRCLKNISIWNDLMISQTMNDLSVKMKLKKADLNMILRTAITGDQYSPSINLVIYLLGYNTTLFRIKKAIKCVRKKNL
ncbi:glutamate--tRNA ligase [Buchnera aphidicola (Hyadaphis tataricae)]|uniref:Glutamate--tRNA ligase n=1 Tax=Buchnera aphidicola (Hyadaphis tataricae) TaxID=1241859 RepID=A0A4D6XXX4_9GAMM|nr:glutamate--tRNA ligase [Buchnera aphidicola]QCI21393.1 glutamate--tRNA ligase [Buchnera aphidicola (Hyadaphis tataricae)]